MHRRRRRSGPRRLFGPVFAAAVVLSADAPIRGLNDSKLLEPAERGRWPRDRAHAAAWSVAADCFEIDRFNILKASRLAMRRAVTRPPRLPAGGRPAAGLARAAAAADPAMR
jgi:ribonuclease HII